MAHMTMLEDLKRAAWSRTSPVQGYGNSWEFRKDCLGNLIRYEDFGNRHSPFGWELASDRPDSAQALHWKSHAGRPHLEPRLMTVAESEYARRRR